MGGPIGFGVYKALDEHRRRTSHAGPAPAPGRGWWYFVITTLCLSWLTAGLLGRSPIAADEPMASRLLWASVLYAVTMGWQPLLAAWLAKLWRDRPTALNGGMRWPRLRDVGLAVAIAAGLAAAAMAIDGLFGGPSAFGLSIDAGDAGSALVVVIALALLCLQALTEEYGWRGTPMTYAIERWGVRAGLIVHGLVWGAWYAPLFLLSGPTPVASLYPAGGFAITCMLLGIVLGWLRLRSRSIAPPAIANALLTIVAGLPLLLQDGSSGLRDAVFRWPGWPVIGIAALLVLVLRRRDLESAPAAR